MIDDSDYALRIPRQVSSPLPGYIVFRRSLQVNDPVLDCDPRLAEPACRYQNVCESLSDVAVPGDGLDIDFTGRLGLAFRHFRRYWIVFATCLPGSNGDEREEGAAQEYGAN
ncbi:MAG: hypothetical protein WD448_00270 [Woeseia sp.]